MGGYLKLGQVLLEFFDVSWEWFLNQRYVEIIFYLLNLQLSTEKAEVSEEDYGFLTENLGNPYARRFQRYPPRVFREN